MQKIFLILASAAIICDVEGRSLGPNREKRQNSFFDPVPRTTNGGNQQNFPYLFGQNVQQPSSFSVSQPGSNDWFQNYILSGKPVGQFGTGINVEKSNRGDAQIGVGQNFGVFETGWQPGIGINAGPHNPGFGYGWNVPVLGSSAVNSGSNYNFDVDNMRWNQGTNFNVGPVNAFSSGLGIDLGLVRDLMNKNNTNSNNGK